MPPIAIADPYELIDTRYGPMLVNRNDTFMGQALIQYGEYSRKELEIILRLMEFPGTAIEVGANMGVFTVPMAQMLAKQDRALLAFEPQTIIYQQLCANLALNGLMNVLARAEACNNHTGSLAFESPDYCRKGNFGAAVMREMNGGTLQAPHVVSCVRLDDLMRSQQVSMIKIDVEGSELKVLQGAELILKQSRPALYVENDRPDQSAELLQWLVDHQYVCWWDFPRIYNEDNYRGEQQNSFPNVASCNVICLPVECGRRVSNSDPIMDVHYHPFAGMVPPTIK